MNAGDDEDHWIADFLDWIDEASVNQPVPMSSEQRVEHFVRTCNRNVPSSIKQLLLKFADDDDPIGDLAATAVLDWIDTDSPTDSTTDSTTDGIAELTLPMPLGDYTLLEEIGRGGMGVVYRAIQSSLDRPVCVKLAPAGMEERARLVREAKLAGELHHPNIVAVFDAGTCDGRSFIAMEFVDGQTLSALLAPAPLDSRTAATMLDEICAAVEFAHERKILHRDLKPSNVLVDRSGRPRVADFGLAKRLRPTRQSTTETLTGVAGSPSYMSPEQVRDDELDVQTDVYGLGAMLYEMLSGRPPLVGNTPWETMRLVESTEPVALGRLQVGLPRDLETICHKCLEKRPHNRYATVDALREELQRFLDDRPVLARPTGRLVRAARWARRNPSISGAALVVAVSLVATMAIGGWMLSQTRQALAKTTRAELNQRALAEELGKAVEVTNGTLFRSQIIQASQALSVNDMVSARRALTEIESTPALNSLGRIELDALRRRAWPALSTIDTAGTQFDDYSWNNANHTLVTLSETGTIESYSSAGIRVGSACNVTLQRSPSPAILSVHPNRTLVAGASRTRVEWIDVESNAQRGGAVLRDPVIAIQWHPNSENLIALTQPGDLFFVDTGTQRTIRLDRLGSQHRKIAFSADGGFLSTMSSKQIDIWDWNRIQSSIQQEPSLTNQPDLSIENQGWLLDQVWCGNQTLVLLSEFGTVSAVQVTRLAGGGVRDRQRWTIETGSLDAANLQTTENELRVIGPNQMAGVDANNGQFIWRHSLPERAAIRSDHSSSLIAVKEAGIDQVQIWDSDRFATPQMIASTGVPVRKIAVGNHGNTVAWRDVDGQTAARNQSWKKNSVALNETPVPATGIALSPVDDLIAISRENDVILYRLPELVEFARISDHQSIAWCLNFAPSGRLMASGDSNGTVLIVDTHNGIVRHSYSGFQDDIRAIEFLSNKTGGVTSFLVADGSDQIKRCEIESGAINALPSIDTTTINALTQVGNNHVAVADSLGKISILDLAGIETTISWTAHTGPVWALCGSRDRLISAGQDGTVRIWDEAGNLILVLASLQEPIWSIDHDPDKQKIYGTTTSGNIFALAY